MDAKLKAEELVSKFKPMCHNVKHTGILDGLATVMNDEVVNFYAAKQCALIAVEEIIKSEKLDYLFTQNQINSMESTSDDRWIHETFVDYWEQVKHELEKL